MIYTVTLNPCADCIMTFDALEHGALNRAKTQELRFGGKGINVSRVLAELGIPSVALGFTGGFTGDAIAASLKGTPVTPDFVALRGGFSRVNVKVITPGGETELNAPGPRVEADELDALFAKLDALGKG
ncbi:MAG: 1-phosphofructokinase, partial [Clostridia bacterium]|nr:1-phosphofructokinase [Clostridia bacterium]